MYIVKKYIIHVINMDIQTYGAVINNLWNSTNLSKDRKVLYFLVGLHFFIKTRIIEILHVDSLKMKIAIEKIK